MLNGVLVDHLSTEELRFVIGHECGHIQNNHVVYLTALYYLMYSANLFVRWIVTPAVLALQSWTRRAEVTCDRAGLICSGDVDVALAALTKLRARALVIAPLRVCYSVWPREVEKWADSPTAETLAGLDLVFAQAAGPCVRLPLRKRDHLDGDRSV